MLRVPIGISDFKILRQDGYYFVDKSNFILEVLAHPAQAILLPRPRRFGKTINLSMLAYFLDHHEDHRDLFKGLSIYDCPSAMVHAFQYPTLFLTFKDIKSDDWMGCKKLLSVLLSELFLKHKATVLAAKPEHMQLERVRRILDGVADESELCGALALLTQLLHRATGKRVVLLIDEYDNPIHAGYQNGYYDEVVALMRGLLGGGLKDNSSLQKGVITGIMRVAQESIFSGLNSLDVFTVLDKPFAAAFGFKEAEVHQILLDADQLARESSFRQWYNGYHFGDELVFNPWSIIKAVSRDTTPCQAYWVGTSDNELIRQRVFSGDLGSDELSQLLSGHPLRRKLDQSIVLGRETQGQVWSFLVYAGYLTVQGPASDNLYDLVIPNQEVRSFFEDSVGDWLSQVTNRRGLAPLYRALLTRDLPALTEKFSDLVKQVLSYHDTAGEEPERVYHAFFLGLLVDLNVDYEVTSNRESGFGRFDVALFPRDSSKFGFLLEFKKASEHNLDTCAQRALSQMTDLNYAAAFEGRGIAKVYQIGIAVCGKRVALAASELNLSG